MPDKYKYVYSYQTKKGIRYYYSYKGIVKRGYKTSKGAFLALSRVMKMSVDDIKKLTFNDLVKKYKNYRFAYGEFTTHERINGEINNYILGVIPDKLVLKLEMKDFEKFYSNLKNSKLSHKNRVLNRLLEIFKHLDKAYNFNCPYPFRLPKFNDDTSIDFNNLDDDNFYTPDELINIVDSISIEDKNSFFKKLCVAFVVMGCCRISEMRGLKWDHYKDGRIFIETQLYRGKEKKLKSKNSYRKFTLLSFLKDYLDQWKLMTKYNKDKDYIFKHPGTKKVVSPQTVRRWIQDASAEAGLKYYNPHKGRHTIASFIRQVGGDEYTMAEILGHSPEIAKKVYAHCFQDEKNQAINAMDEAFNRIFDNKKNYQKNKK